MDTHSQNTQQYTTMKPFGIIESADNYLKIPVLKADKEIPYIFKTSQVTEPDDEI